MVTNRYRRGEDANESYDRLNTARTIIVVDRSANVRHCGGSLREPALDRGAIHDYQKVVDRVVLRTVRSCVGCQ
jgi:hypothetical protein